MGALSRAMPKPPPAEPEHIRFEIRLTRLEYAALKRKAAKLGIPRAEVLRQAVNRALAED